MEYHRNIRESVQMNIDDMRLSRLRMLAEDVHRISTRAKS